MLPDCKHTARPHLAASNPRTAPLPFALDSSCLADSGTAEDARRAVLKRAAMTIALIYATAGLGLALYEYERELRTFECRSDGEQSYWSVGQESYENPDPERCTRRAFTGHAVTSTAILIIVGPLLLAARLVP